MTIQPDAPADTRMMGIVHHALRRDLHRAQAALAVAPPPSARQQYAIARHLTWMMSFLRAHHRSEDDGLFPLVRERNPAAGALFDAMDAEHEAVEPAISAVEAAAATFRPGDTDRHLPRLVTALDRLTQVLLPHLRHEEDEAMPVVSATISHREWRALEDEHNIKPKSFAELGYEGHWLIDDVSAQDRQTVLGLVPPIPRFLLLHGFAASYRRKARACWGVPARSGVRAQNGGRCEVRTDDALDAVWSIIRDVTRIGEWSHECVAATWIGGATSATAGARFRGRSRSGLFGWARVCEILSAEPYELVWRTVPTRLYPGSTVWRIRLHPEAGGTRIEQTFSVPSPSRRLDLLYGIVIPAHRDRTAALIADLQRLADLARRSTQGGRRLARV